MCAFVQFLELNGCHKNTQNTTSETLKFIIYLYQYKVLTILPSKQYRYSKIADFCDFLYKKVKK